MNLYVVQTLVVTLEKRKSYLNDKTVADNSDLMRTISMCVKPRNNKKLEWKT